MRKVRNLAFSQNGNLGTAPQIEPVRFIAPVLPLLVFSCMREASGASDRWVAPAGIGSFEARVRRIVTISPTWPRLFGATVQRRSRSLRASAPLWLSLPANPNRELQLLEGTLTLSESATSLFLIANATSICVPREHRDRGTCFCGCTRIRVLHALSKVEGTEHRDRGNCSSKFPCPRCSPAFNFDFRSHFGPCVILASTTK